MLFYFDLNSFNKLLLFVIAVAFCCYGNFDLVGLALSPLTFTEDIFTLAGLRTISKSPMLKRETMLFSS